MIGMGTFGLNYAQWIFTLFSSPGQTFAGGDVTEIHLDLGWAIQGSTEDREFLHLGSSGNRGDRLSAGMDDDGNDLILSP